MKNRKVRKQKICKNKIDHDDDLTVNRRTHDANLFQSIGTQQSINRFSFQINQSVGTVKYLEYVEGERDT